MGGQRGGLVFFWTRGTCMCVLTWPDRCAPEPSRMTELSLELKSESTWFRMNSITTDWMRTSIKAAVPPKQADSICLDLGRASMMLVHYSQQPHEQMSTNTYKHIGGINATSAVCVCVCSSHILPMLCRFSLPPPVSSHSTETCSKMNCHCLNFPSCICYCLL